MRTVLLITCATLVLASCTRDRANVHAFNGVNYRGKVSSTRADRQHFVATVSPVSKGLEGAIEAGRYEGTKHCIEFYGTSDIDWVVGPDTPQDQLRLDGDALTFQGACAG
ncbi:hypothetical protein [Puniceibacterium sp. IMCC21224]|uniref:hypothetical protein n=1 Tax=Puniceibacterium sp. IMCC21224 TaxID=1618204 RepID=UPI00064DAFC2|nr:hypothetical protein [Puniceibacterium sp. IMCC21224]